MAPIPPDALGHRLRFGRVLAVGYALWPESEDGGRAVAMEEAGVAEGLEGDVLARSLAGSARVGLA